MTGARILRGLAATAIAVTFVLGIAGCAHFRGFPRSSSADCPPGHRWSDGKCHSTGKGHDPAKHSGKGKKKN